MAHKSQRPYMTVGVDRLTARIYKTGNEKFGWNYHFRLCRDGNRGANEDLRFHIDDIQRLMRITRLVAFELAVDGCMTPTQREQLQRFVRAINAVQAQETKLSEQKVRER